MAESERLIADIMSAQQRLQHLFAYDRSDPLFTSQLTMSQLKILLLLSRGGTASGRELAGLMGVSLATLTGMVDRLVAQNLIARHEDPTDRRVRRITLTSTGADVIGGIITAGAEKQRRLLDHLDVAELRVVEQAMSLLVRAATAELGGDAATHVPPCCPAADVADPTRSPDTPAVTPPGHTKSLP
ncbi:MAG TPA: MarR family transcriptional regulator [Actinoplanes sp.]